MKKTLLIVITALLCITCNIKKKDVPTLDTNMMNDIEDQFRALLLSENLLSDKEIRDYDGYKFEIPMGTCFWDEFGDYESQFNLTENESKLLGKWMNSAMNTGSYYRTYSFFPNNFLVVSLDYQNYLFIENEKIWLNRAIGTWEIVNGIVKITIYSIETEDDEKPYPYNKDIILLEQPYTVDFINIDNISEHGYTKKPAFAAVLSKELQKQVKVILPNKTNNIYLRNVYSMDWVPKVKKNYNYFTYFPEMAKGNYSGLEIATNPELIRKYIPDWMY
jgi:hypothetical protein